MDKGISNLAARFMNIPPDSLAGNAEHRCCLFLFKVLQIDQFQYRYLFRKQGDNYFLFIRAALWRIAPR
jgi:hypothetical protein